MGLTPGNTYCLNLPVTDTDVNIICEYLPYITVLIKTKACGPFSIGTYIIYLYHISGVLYISEIFAIKLQVYFKSALSNRQPNTSIKNVHMKVSSLS